MKSKDRDAEGCLNAIMTLIVGGLVLWALNICVKSYEHRIGELEHRVHVLEDRSKETK